MTPLYLYAVCVLILGVELVVYQVCLWMVSRREQLDACREYTPEEDR